MIGGIALTLLLGLVSAVIGVMLKDFVIPAMYLRGARVMAGWGIVRREVVRGHVGEVVLYLLMRLVVTLAVGIMAILAVCVTSCFTCCLTCCLVMIPYLGTVLLLPVPVMIRHYSLCFLEQLGPGWQIFGPDLPPLEPPAPAALA